MSPAVHDKDQPLTHLNAAGEAHMVDVGSKATTARRAVATGQVQITAEGFAALAKGAPKGDVLATARVAGIMAAKRTSDLIPLCHAIALSRVQVDLDVAPLQGLIRITATTEASDRTGVEMEALTAVSVAALTIYDMLKAVDRGMTIGGIRLVEKSGGRGGPYTAPVKVVPKGPRPSAESRAYVPGAQQSLENLRQSAAPMPVVPTEPDSTQTFEGRSHPDPDPESTRLRGDVQTFKYTDRILVDYLQADPIARAYMLGDLDQPFAEHGHWFGLPDEAGSLRALVLLYTGLSMPAVLTSGDPVGVEAVLGAVRGELPRRFYAHLRASHLSPTQVFYELRGVKTMCRMGLERAAYVPQGGGEAARVLTHRDTGAMMQLYRHYPDNFFDPALLDTGLYFGVQEADELLSVAGLHVLSEKHDVAAIGNIVTHTEHRGRGLATRCVDRLLSELLPKVGHVALNVDQSNVPAIACYRKFGFDERYPFYEGWAAPR